MQRLRKNGAIYRRLNQRSHAPAADIYWIASLLLRCFGQTFRSMTVLKLRGCTVVRCIIDTRGCGAAARKHSKELGRRRGGRNIGLAAAGFRQARRGRKRDGQRVRGRSICAKPETWGPDRRAGGQLRGFQLDIRAARTAKLLAGRTGESWWCRECDFRGAAGLIRGQI